MESASSSKDEHQHCWHYRPEVSGDQCCGCFETQREEASPDELCQCGHGRKAHSALSTVGCADCSPFRMGKHLFMAVPAKPETAGEPEAPKCEGCEHPGHGDEPCGQCPCGHPVPAPVIPSHAVAYAIGSGALYELVLPDEMTCAVVDGVLVLSHPSGVLGIQQVKPTEGA